MAESHVITALVSKRAELAGLLEHHEEAIQQLRDDITAIEASIKIFKPDYDLHTIKAKAYRATNEYFQPREANRLILEVLREAGEPIDTGKITKRIAAKKGYKLEDIDYTKFQAYLLAVLSRQKRKGVIHEVGRVGAKRVILWRISNSF